MELNKVLERVRALIDKAEAPIAPGANEAQRRATEVEQEAARRMADSLMLQYAIEEATLDKSRPAAAQSKPAIIKIALTIDQGLIGYMSQLASSIAGHCNCRISHYAFVENGAYGSKIYGYESDLRYFEILYTTLRLHMIGALRPSIDQSKSIEDNTYALHNAGLNWFDIAKMYGWRGPVTPLPGEPRLMYWNEQTGERKSWSKAIAQYKQAYQKAIDARGEAWLKIPPSGTETFRRSSAMGYVKRIEQRLRDIRAHRQIGSELSLRRNLVDDLFRQDNPDLFRPVTMDAGAKPARALKYKEPAFSQSAYEAGMRHANSASLNPAASHNPAKEIG